MFLGVSHLAGDTWEIPLTVIGVLLVIYAHATNLRRTEHRH